MAIGKLNQAADTYSAMVEQLDRQAPCTDQDGFEEFRQKHGAYAHLNLEDIFCRSQVDPDLGAAVEGYWAELQARKQHALDTYDRAIREAETELSRLKGIRDRARGPQEEPGEPEAGLLDDQRSY